MANARRRESVRPYFAGFVIEGNSGAPSLAEAQRLVTERLVRHVARQVAATMTATSCAGEAAD